MFDASLAQSDLTNTKYLRTYETNRDVLFIGN